MARPPSQLQTIFETIMEIAGQSPENVFLQPPTVLPDPCIKYNRDDSWVVHADNLKFATFKRYLVTVIDRNPDSLIPDLVEALPHCGFDRFYTANGVNHWTYNLYF